MRKIVLIALVLICGRGDKAETTARDNAASRGKLDIVTVMPAFRKVLDARRADDVATRARRFQREVIDACPAPDGPVVPANAGFGASEYLARIETLRPTMRDLGRAQVDASLAIRREAIRGREAALDWPPVCAAGKFGE